MNKKLLVLGLLSVGVMNAQLNHNQLSNAQGFIESTSLIKTHGIYIPGVSLEKFKKDNGDTSIIAKFALSLLAAGVASAPWAALQFIQCNSHKGYPNICQVAAQNTATLAFYTYLGVCLNALFYNYMRYNENYEMYQKMEREGTLPAHYHEVVNLIKQQPFLRNNYY
jgi:hypothetical protein